MHPKIGKNIKRPMLLNVPTMANFQRSSSQIRLNFDRKKKFVNSKQKSIDFSFWHLFNDGYFIGSKNQRTRNAGNNFWAIECVDIALHFDFFHICNDFKAMTTICTVIFVWHWMIQPNRIKCFTI